MKILYRPEGQTQQEMAENLKNISQPTSSATATDPKNVVSKNDNLDDGFEHDTPITDTFDAGIAQSNQLDNAENDGVGGLENDGSLNHRTIPSTATNPLDNAVSENNDVDGFFSKNDGPVHTMTIHYQLDNDGIDGFDNDNDSYVNERKTSVKPTARAEHFDPVQHSTNMESNSCWGMDCLRRNYLRNAP